jgi:hypothetical protein
MSAGLQPWKGVGGSMWVQCTHCKSGSTLYEFALSKKNMLISHSNESTKWMQQLITVLLLVV